MSNQMSSDKSNRMEGKVLLPLYYFPPITYFEEVIKHSELELEACETFQKQTYRNRAVIATGEAREKLDLIIPIQQGRSHTPIRDTKIDYSQRWNKIHLGAIKAAYGKAPFFDSFYGDVESILTSPYTYLWDLNHDVLTMCLNTLRINLELSYSSDYEVVKDSSGSIDQRVVQSVTESQEFVLRQNAPSFYVQKTGSVIVEGLSILDLIFHVGAESYLHFPMAK
ncbi:MAG: WbqC family protein [Cytophagaceae bacterium]